MINTHADIRKMDANVSVLRNDLAELRIHTCRLRRTNRANVNVRSDDDVL